MTEELKPCPFCGGEASTIPDASHTTAWEIGCYSSLCAVEPHVWAVHKSTAQLQWNTRAVLAPIPDKWEEIDSTMTRIIQAERDAAIASSEKAVARVAELEEVIRNEIKRSRRHLSAQTLAVLAEEHKP